MTGLPLSESWWEIESEQLDLFRRGGLKQRYFFPHQLRYLRRPGSDGYRLAQRMYGLPADTTYFELVLHADESALREFPPDLFFDRDIIWHQQHLGLPGHIAVADLALTNGCLYTTARFSDVVQRIPRRRDLKTRIENVFRGWDHMLLNGILHFARVHDCQNVYFPTADLAREHTDRSRNPQPQMFERLYDHHLERFAPVREGRTWIVDPRLAHPVIAPKHCERRYELERTICLCHDTERGFGYRDIDTEFATRADAEAPAALAPMLEIERKAGALATYDVVGCFLPEVRSAIEESGHAVAFHSFDHSASGDQLHLCRKVDYRIPGYRVPRSRIGSELSDDRLAFHNFEWLASACKTLGCEEPRIQNGVVKMPIYTDDFPLHTGATDYEPWESRILAEVERRPFLALGLHDCYAPRWLGHFSQLLARLGERGRLRRCDDVANAIVLANAV